MSNTQKLCRSRRTLDLAERIAVIEAFEKSGESKRTISRKYKCSLSQIKNIIRRKQEYLIEWENNGDLLQVSKKQSACFLTVGAVVCEFAHRLINHGLRFSDEILCKKGQEAASLLGTFEVRTTKYWLERIHLKFRIFQPPDNTIKKTLDIEEIIRELMPSYSPNCKYPQLLDHNIIQMYVRDTVANQNESEIASVNTASLPDRSYQNTNGSISDDAISIVDVKLEEEEEEVDDVIMVSNDPEPKSTTKPISSYEEALRHLSPLEEFVLMKEDVRATGLINRLENLFKENMKDNL